MDMKKALLWVLIASVRQAHHVDASEGSVLEFDRDGQLKQLEVTS